MNHRTRREVFMSSPPGLEDSSFRMGQMVLDFWLVDMLIAFVFYLIIVCLIKKQLLYIVIEYTLHIL